MSEQIGNVFQVVVTNEKTEKKTDGHLSVWNNGCGDVDWNIHDETWGHMKMSPAEVIQVLLLGGFARLKEGSLYIKVEKKSSE